VNLWRDKYFGAAILAAPVTFALLFSIIPPSANLSWPIKFPEKFLLLVFIYPVLEELTFRGLLQGALLKIRFGRNDLVGISFANLLTSLLFMLLHFLYHPILWALSVFIPSLIFGYFRDKYNSILPGTLLHIIYNAGYFCLFYSLSEAIA